MQKALLFLSMLALVSGMATAQDSNWLDRVVKVTGTGAPSMDDPNPARAKLMARRAAVMDAYRQLLENLMGIQIDSSTSVKDFVTEYDEINGKVQGHIRGMQAVATRYNPDGTVEVDMELRVADLFPCFEEHLYFRTPVLPGCNIFVIDCSGSMSERGYNTRFSDRWTMAVTELKKAIDNLLRNKESETEQRFGIIFFSDRIKSVYGLKKVKNQYKREAHEAIDYQRPQGATNYHDPLRQAIAWANSLPQDQVMRKTIYLLGDGEPNRGPQPYWQKIFQLAQGARGIKINVIYCGSTDVRTEANMRKLAEIGGGTFIKE